MPLFDYKCKKCGIIEILVLEEDEEIICPKCKGKVEKQISYKSNFQLKGKGWFKDGYNKN